MEGQDIRPIDGRHLIESAGSGELGNGSECVSSRFRVSVYRIHQPEGVVEIVSYPMGVHE